MRGIMPVMTRTRFVARWTGSAMLMGIAAALLPALAFAHPGHESNSAFQAGLFHPWTGLDHLAAMLAVGVWAALMRNQSLPAMLVATAVGIGAGSMLGGYPDALTYGEQVTVASVIVIGLLATFAGQPRKPLAVIMVALFCLFHGYVHALSIPPHASQWVFSSGFLLSMLALQVLGAMLAVALSRREPLARSAGACCSVIGLVLLLH